MTSTSAGAAAATPAELAKAALRQLLTNKLEPTPENYARAYRAEAGQAAPPPPPPIFAGRALALLDRLVAAAAPEAEAAARQTCMQALIEGRWDSAERALDKLGSSDTQAAALATLIERIVRGVERGGRHWTRGRRKESLLRVLAGSRGDSHLLQRRLSQLVGGWESDAAPASPEGGDVAAEAPVAAPADGAAIEPSPATAAAQAQEAWKRVLALLAGSAQSALPQREASDLGEALVTLVQAIAADGPTPDHVDELTRLCERVDRVLQHQHHLTDQLGGLCLELTASLGDLAEDESWAKGQLDAIRLTLEEGISARGVRSVVELLSHTRAHHGKLRDERGRAREALKSLIGQMLRELGELGSQTGRFHENVGRYAHEIERAESLESLTTVVGEMLIETRSVQETVSQTHQRLQAEVAHASQLSQRVTELESELRRLSEEVSTDQLTQIANRRGMMQAFERARAAIQADSHPLSIGLLDIDNFKRLNDELGHSIGDEALRSLAGAVTKALRPEDAVARFGGEEFVVLLPQTPVTEGQQILTRLQRSLSGGLFMHERKTVFVTFSAGVTAYRFGESMEQALERADAALYEAKRTGKNRTCIG